MHQNPGLLQECEAVYQRELERERKAQEKRERAIAANKDFEDVARVPPEQSIGTTETSGPITLGEPVPGRLAMPPVTPLRAPQAEGLSNGTSGDGTQHATNGSTAPSNDDTHMTDSQDLNVNTHHDFQFQTPSRIEGQTRTRTIITTAPLRRLLGRRLQTGLRTTSLELKAVTVLHHPAYPISQK